MIDKYNAKENHCQQKNPQKIPRAKRQSRSATGEILARPASRAGVRVSLWLFLDASGCMVLQSLRIAWQALRLGHLLLLGRLAAPLLAPLSRGIVADAPNAVIQFFGHFHAARAAISPGDNHRAARGAGIFDMGIDPIQPPRLKHINDKRFLDAERLANFIDTGRRMVAQKRNDLRLLRLPLFHASGAIPSSVFQKHLPALRAILEIWQPCHP